MEFSLCCDRLDILIEHVTHECKCMIISEISYMNWSNKYWNSGSLHNSSIPTSKRMPKRSKTFYWLSLKSRSSLCCHVLQLCWACTFLIVGSEKQAKEILDIFYLENWTEPHRRPANTRIPGYSQRTSFASTSPCNFDGVYQRQRESFVHLCN